MKIAVAEEKAPLISWPICQKTEKHRTLLVLCTDTKHGQCAPPDVKMKEKLHQAGLGHNKVCFNWKANAVDVKTKLKEVFLKLVNSGGFDILRHGQETSELVTTCHSYGIQVGQAVAFI